MAPPRKGVPNWQNWWSDRIALLQLEIITDHVWMPILYLHSAARPENVIRSGSALGVHHAWHVCFLRASFMVIDVNLYCFFSQVWHLFIIFYAWETGSIKYPLTYSCTKGEVFVDFGIVKSTHPTDPHIHRARNVGNWYLSPSTWWQVARGCLWWGTLPILRTCGLLWVKRE